MGGTFCSTAPVKNRKASQAFFKAQHRKKPRLDTVSLLCYFSLCKEFVSV